jgi:hypothetical protein
MDQYLRLRTKGPGQSIWSIQQRKLRAELPRGYRVNLHCTFGSV